LQPVVDILIKALIRFILYPSNKLSCVLLRQTNYLVASILNFISNLDF
jgi:hypothetical protein